MTTLKLANLAREAHSTDLFERGVHGLSVEKVILAGKSTFAVVAMVQPSSKSTLPEALEVTDVALVLSSAARVSTAALTANAAISIHASTAMA